jgi:hypothetical protein
MQWRATAPSRPSSPSRGRQRRSAGHPHDQAPARVLERPPHATASNDADEEQRIDLQRLRELRVAGPAAERDRRQSRRLRLDVGLAEEEGEAGAEQHQGDADGDVVDLGQLADPAVQRAEDAAGQPAASTPSHAEPLS